MSANIRVGKIEVIDGYKTVDFPYSNDKTENDGTSIEHNLTAGWPTRGLYDIKDWTKSCKVMADIYEASKANDRVVPLDNGLMNRINALPKKGGLDGDRNQWLRYWCARAVAEYGNESGIEITE